jgi:hypothetical protein
MPLAWEFPNATSALSYARWLLRTNSPEVGVRFANAPAFRTHVFIHIPKTAGTAVVETLQRSPSVAVVNAEGLGRMARRERSKLLYRALHSRHIFLRSHAHLKHWTQYLTWNGREEIFTVLRDPMQVQLSNINFIVGRVRQVLEDAKTDSAFLSERMSVWRQRFASGAYGARTEGNLDAVASWLAMTDEPFSLSERFAASILASEPYRAIYAEIIHNFLGLGNVPVEQTVKFVGRFMDIVPIDSLGAYVEHKFGLQLMSGVNARMANVIGADGVGADVWHGLLGRDVELHAKLGSLAWEGAAAPATGRARRS